MTSSQCPEWMQITTQWAINQSKQPIYGPPVIKVKKTPVISGNYNRSIIAVNIETGEALHFASVVECGEHIGRTASGVYLAINEKRLIATKWKVSYE